jgi:SAM-dependent methyltransferase
MNIAEYHKMHQLERHYWWFQGRRHLILTLLQQVLGRIPRTPATGESHAVFLDLGCGTGMLLDDLSHHGSAIGLDFSPLALEFSRQRGLPNLLRGDAMQCPFPSGSADIVTALDIIEHVPDDHAMVREIHRILRPGGHAIMTVPAHKTLWSKHDVALHHFRRYEKPEFEALIRSAGLVPVRYSFAMATAYLPAAIWRSLRPKPSESASADNPDVRTDEFPIPLWLNKLLLFSLKCEVAWLRRHDLPIGLSLVCVAQKPPRP